MHVASRLHNGVAEFTAVQILDLARTGVEIFVDLNDDGTYWMEQSQMVGHPKKSGRGYYYRK